MLVALLIAAALGGVAAFGHFRGNFDLDERVVGLLAMLGGVAYFVRRLAVAKKVSVEQKADISSEDSQLGLLSIHATKFADELCASVERKLDDADYRFTDEEGEEDFEILKQITHTSLKPALSDTVRHCERLIEEIKKRRKKS